MPAPGARRQWSGAGEATAPDDLARLLGQECCAAIDPFDRPQLSFVISQCRASASLSAAGRILFAVSRTQKSSSNDADRLRKYLARLDLTFDGLSAAALPSQDL